MMAELMGRMNGSNRGLGGSMHIADPRQGVFGANGIVAAGVPIAVGSAVAQQTRDDGSVTVAFFGDGAVAQGAFHEATNLAALWSLPIILFCENNRYAEFASSAEQHPVPLEARAAGYGIEFHSVDGNDAEAVAEAMNDIVGKVRSGGGPVMVEAQTYRWHGHYEGDPQRYRSESDVESWKGERDPVNALHRRLVGLGTAKSELADVISEVEDQIERAVLFAREGPLPPSDLPAKSTYAPRPDVPEGKPVEGGSDATFKTMDAIRMALEVELEVDPNVIVAGVDVGEGGNVFGLTRGLHERWPTRVRDTPISETAIVGLAVGAAMAGMRPVVELMYLDFLGVCFDQLLNQAAKLHFMTGGNAEMGLTVRTQFGAGRSSGSQHSQSLEALLAHIPGLTVVMPSTPADTYGLLRSAIRDPNPVVFVENRLLYGMKGPQPPKDHFVPIGKAAVRRRGRDITLVSVSRMVHEALAAADEVSSAGVDVEVIDLRTVAPLDIETVIDSFARTGRLLIAHEAVVDFGIGAEIAAKIADLAFWSLDAPIRRVGASATPAPYSPALEHEWLPDRTRIARELLDLAEI